MKKFKQILKDIKIGKPILVVDDYDREFEGDIVIAGEKASVENLVFCMKHARGLMCLPILQDICDRLNIPMMHRNNNDKYGTPFTVSIDATEGTTTGMSVHDRLKTISVLADDNSKPADLAQPGHLFPLRAHPELLRGRRGHTEAGVELVIAAGLKPIAVIVEVMNDDGTMTKGDQLHFYAKMYNINIISVEEIYNEIYK